MAKEPGARKPRGSKKASATEAAAARAENYASNGLNKKRLHELVTAVEKNNDEVASIMGSAMNAAKKVHLKTKTVYDEARRQGMPIRAVKVEVKRRALERKIIKMRQELEPDDLQSLDHIRDTLGSLVGLPLGHYAVKEAAKEAGMGDEKATAAADELTQQASGKKAGGARLRGVRGPKAKLDAATNEATAGGDKVVDLASRRQTSGEAESETIAQDENPDLSASIA